MSKSSKDFSSKSQVYLNKPNQYLGATPSDYFLNMPSKQTGELSSKTSLNLSTAGASTPGDLYVKLTEKMVDMM